MQGVLSDADADALLELEQQQRQAAGEEFLSPGPVAFSHVPADIHQHLRIGEAGHGAGGTP